MLPILRRKEGYLLISIILNRTFRCKDFLYSLSLGYDNDNKAYLSDGAIPMQRGKKPDTKKE